jgi:4-hydroxy-tetrahydrodipicolinate reductase
VRLIIAGAGGRMGGALIEAAQADAAFEVAAALEAPGSASAGARVGGVRVGTDVGAALAAGDVWIDFTRPEATLAHAAACASAGRAMVIGTTGFAPAQRARIAAAAQRIPIVMAPNFAIGVNAVFELAQTAARILGDAYDVEIVEAHHRHKVDAPSGTALRLGEIVAQALHRDLGEVAVHGRHGETGERPARAIGFHAIRGGDIVGEHTVIFAGVGERVEIAVRSQSRATYALGALRAAKWLAGRAPGLYGMADVLGLGSAIPASV